MKFANNDGSCNGKCNLCIHHVPIFHSCYNYAHNERLVKTLWPDGIGLCDVHIGSGTRYMVQHTQDEDKPHDCVDNPTSINSKLGAAECERCLPTLLCMTDLISLAAVAT